jgi:hypothetical protein
MDEIRLSFEYQYRSIYSFWGREKLDDLLWNDEEDRYEIGETELAYFWYRKGFLAGETG